MSSQDSLCIRLMNDERNKWNKDVNGFSGPRKGMKWVTPGESITCDAGFMRGHGTFFDADSHLTASVAGVIQPINRLVSVKPLRTRYNGEIGDVIVGRIIDVQQKRWKVETNSRLDSILPLAGVNLPAGELRRKTTEDESMMRKYLAEGDLISAEVQNVFEDGSLCLHTRSLKYGKLGQGVLVRVSPSLIERRKTHFHNLPCGAHIILGNNGFIWISKSWSEGAESGGFILDVSLIEREEREVIARLRNCTLALARHKVMLHDTSILYAFDVSNQLNYNIKDILMPEVMNEIAVETKRRLYQSEDDDDEDMG